MNSGKTKFFEYIRPLGIVFGDIGTSPIYTVSLMGFILKQKDPALIMGGISLIFWIIIVVVYIQYVAIVMNLSIRGEGGQLIIREYVLSIVKNNPILRSIVSFLGLLGFSAVVSEGILTPAISILSAVEGIQILNQSISTTHVILISIVITVLLFSLQRRGTDRVSFLFTPVIIVWFIVLFLLGLFYILKEPSILKAVNPMYIWELIRKDPADFLIILSFAMLAITGVEGMYADMGHLGKKPIVFSWNLVFICLITNYFGQGAFFLLNHNQLDQYNSFLFYMVKQSFPMFYIPMIILTLVATIVASQAMISAMFSIFYQTSNLGLLPRVKYIHTSTELKHQIYVPLINWTLMVLVIFTMLFFKSSANLANAYGLSVNITIVISSIMAIIVFVYFKNWFLVILLSLLVLPVDLTILISNTHKFANGAYFPLISATLILCIVLIYQKGNKKLSSKLEYEQLSSFLSKYKEIYSCQSKISGTAIFMLRDIKMISPYICKTIFDFKIVYEKNIFLSLKVTDKPFGIEYSYRNIEEDTTSSLGLVEIKVGYLEIVDIKQILSKLGIDPVIVFYGQENITSRSLIWSFYSFLRKISPSIVDFYNFPLPKTIGITTNIVI
ncbi:MAG: KUP/HAK/KT family potassium transporter [bacterium]